MNIGKIAILLNGPPRAGKDTAVNALVRHFGEDAEVFKFTRPVKDLTHNRFGIDCAHDAFEVTKDDPLSVFGGLTPRQAYIETSARLKAERGEDAVRRLFIEAIMASRAKVILNPDAGDDLEAECVADALGVTRVLVIRIRRDGHDFSKCCRTYVTSPRLEVVDVHNVGSQAEYEREVAELAARFTARLDGQLPPGPAAAAWSVPPQASVRGGEVPFSDGNPGYRPVSVAR